MASLAGLEETGEVSIERHAKPPPEPSLLEQPLFWGLALSLAFNILLALLITFFLLG
jgi:hypothetical protein